MKKYSLSALLLASFIQLASAQSKTPWEAKPTVHKIPAAFSKVSAVVVYEKETIDYVFEFGTAYVYNTVHRIVQVLDDNAIEGFNKMRITNSGVAVSDIQARVILPSGKIIEVPKEKILETKTENNLQQFVFAMEGLEKGAEVECKYTLKNNASLFGTEYFQYGLPVMRAEFELKAPSHLVFETKGYNGFPNAKDSVNADTSSAFGKIYTASMDNIPELKEEEYNNYEANKMRIEYRISYLPETKPNQRQFTWNDLAKGMYEGNYTYTDKEKKVVEKYLKSIGVNKADSELDKIKKIEDELKKNISMSGDVGEENESFDVLVSKKITTESAFKRFFAACLTLAEVPHELGITSNRYEHVLDEKFENWKPLNEYIFYFPGQKKYLAPTAIVTRMPFLPGVFLNNKAVFTKITSLGNIKSAIASVRAIPAEPTSLSNHDLKADVSFKGAGLEPEIKATQILDGYCAIGLRDAFLYVSKEHEKELMSKIMDFAAGMDDLLDYSIQNTALESYYDNKPLLLNATVKANNLMDKAGNKYLFKIGEVIGRQAEMYQNETRKQPIEIAYPHGLRRTLTVQIPEGYKVANPDVVKMNFSYKEDGATKPVIGFLSDYKMEGNKMIISVNEYYDMIQLPLSAIEPYMKVINAAADFNKIVLVLEKI